MIILYHKILHRNKQKTTKKFNENVYKNKNNLIKKLF